VQALYNRYAGMLLGYIFDVVKDEKLAEQYLVDTFKDVSAQVDEFADGAANDYCKLQLLARKKLAPFFDTIKDCTVTDAVTNGNGTRTNKYIERMNTGQQVVFCGVHYHGKTVGALAKELNTDDDAIRRLLKEAFAIIRNNRNDAGVH
jgi:hypothetical protein